jgi:hypothetical protein
MAVSAGFTVLVLSIYATILLKKEDMISNVGVGNIAIVRECTRRSSEDGSSRGLKEWEGRKTNTVLPHFPFLMFAQTLNMVTLYTCRIQGFHRSGYENFYILGCNAV